MGWIYILVPKLFKNTIPLSLFTVSGEMSEVTKKREKVTTPQARCCSSGGLLIYKINKIIKSYYIIYYVDNVYCCISDKSKCPPPT